LINIILDKNDRYLTVSDIFYICTNWFYQKLVLKHNSVLFNLNISYFNSTENRPTI